MSFLKLILLLLLSYILLRLLRGSVRRALGIGATRTVAAGSARTRGARLVRCAACDTYVDEGRAVSSRGQPFCSVRCAERRVSQRA